VSIEGVLWCFSARFLVQSQDGHQSTHHVNCWGGSVQERERSTINIAVSVIFSLRHLYWE